MEPDFSGYATKAGLKCSDGRTIMPDAFKHQDKMTVPLVWQHGHSEATNVLGHAILEARDDGVYAHAYLNETPAGVAAKTLVQHGDVSFLSIYANQLVEKSKQVFHGMIREVSLVLAGANPGAKIDFVAIQHADGETEELEDEAIITTGLEIEHEESSEDLVTHAESDDSNKGGEGGSDKTVQQVYDSFSEEQKAVVHYMIGAALSGSAAHSEPTGEEDLTHQEGEEEMTRNVFEQNGGGTKQDRPTLTHDQLKSIVDDAQQSGSFKDAFLRHAVEYGIEDIDFLFPDAKTIDSAPELISRRMEWVNVVINGARKSPFSRIKTLSADITHDEARAKGYIKGNLKKEEWFKLEKRVTTPTTIYKKQKLDRDDIVDITDLDVVAWLKGEMRVMLDEEIARAVLIGDGREIDDEDKINEEMIRPIAYDDDFYTHKVVIPANITGDGVTEHMLRARPKYRGRGNPTLFVTEDFLTDMLLVKDKMGRRLYPTAQDFANAVRVSNIVTVDVMDNQDLNGGDLVAVMVNMSDYTMGADRGGNVSMFDDFDIDYNQYKYLIEGRMSGALTKFKTAIAFTRGAGTLVADGTDPDTAAGPDAPTFNNSTGVLTIPDQEGVIYRNADTGTTYTAGAQAPIAAGATVEVEAVPEEGYYFPRNIDTDWEFTRNA